ncbi:hypothetical protein D6D26_04469 [Aureobasidium pullulans]|nr:hypothetical protein D6D26_04469 [Aureobasidium pullulans]
MLRPVVNAYRCTPFLTHHLYGQKSRQNDTPEIMADNNVILITAGPYQFLAKFEEEAPKTVATFQTLLPYRQKIIHVRWSGEAVWIPLGEADFKLEFENHTAYPAAGQILFYPGGFSETELLFCYGNVAFASKMGALAANHFLTIIEGQENLKALGKLVLWEGAQDVLFEIADQVKYAHI